MQEKQLTHLQDQRVIQAKRLFDKGFGGEASFEQYLESIPTIPEFPESYLERFPELILVDARLRITKQCELLGINFPGDDQTYVDFDSNQARTDKVYWMRVQNGAENRFRSVQECRKTFTEDELGLTVYEGLALFAQNPKVLKRDFAMDLPGSVHLGGRGYAAYFLNRSSGQPRLHWDWDYGPDPNYGSASRGK